MLSLLLSSPERVFRRDEILRDVWGDAVIGDRTIDVHVRKLRERFGDKVIQTIKGVGYKFAG
ncbi:MAG: two-component system alkaline phosphatase synthesis response regulator PhoP [Arenicella sp.]